LYGDSIDFKKHQRFLYETLEAAKNKCEISIYGSKDPLRNYLNVSDFNEIILRVIENRVFGSYNCLNPVNVSFTEIAELANEIFQNDQAILFLKEHKDIPDNIFKFDDDLYKIIDFIPGCSLRDGLLLIANKNVIR
jgi:nucleoside-diphosphate-sugar epimerase